MTEKQFTLTHINEQYLSANLYDNGTFIASIGIGAELIVELLNTLSDENEQLTHDATVLIRANQDYRRENEQLKTTISRLIEQNRKNNDLLVSDIRLLEKALWCPNCTRNIKRLKELKKEFEK